MMTKRIQILIVDNQLRARQSMKALLGAWQSSEEIREATNGKEAIQIAEEFKPELILMDIRMPVMNGIEAAKIIKARLPQIKIILLSMYSEYEADALAAGADAFISKTDSPQKLIATVATMVGDLNQGHPQ
jgi:YesN/AraC family two-component response regulator